MEVQPDFRDLLALLNAHKVEYLVVGGYALAFHPSISGVSWEEAEATREPGTFGDVPVFYIGRQAYIRNKRAVGRTKDLADIEALGAE
jgi:hypothetical protein